MEKYVEKCAQNGIGCIIPRLPKDLAPSAELLTQIMEFYDVLTAAAMTYVAALATSLLTLVRLVLLASGRRR